MRLVGDHQFGRSRLTALHGDAIETISSSQSGRCGLQHLPRLGVLGRMDGYFLRRYLPLLRADLAQQMERVRQLRENVASLKRSGRDDRIASARLQDAEETLAFYAAELARLEREAAID